MVHTDSMFSVGNAMSRAPIMSGMQKFPNAPMRMGVTAKKIMIVPCIVKSDVYAAGEITPPAGPKRRRPTTGTGARVRQLPADEHGMNPPTARKQRPSARNCFAMTL